MVAMEIESGLSKFTTLHTTTKIDGTDPWEAWCTHPDFLSFISQRWAEQKHMTNCFKASLLKISREKITRSIFAQKYPIWIVIRKCVHVCVTYLQEDVSWLYQLTLWKVQPRNTQATVIFLFLPLNSSGKAKTYFKVPEVDRLHTIQP